MRSKKQRKAKRKEDHYKPKRIPKYNTKWQHLVKRDKRVDKNE